MSHEQCKIILCEFQNTVVYIILKVTKGLFSAYKRTETAKKLFVKFRSITKMDFIISKTQNSLY